jgi:hypothetical protein
VFSLICGNFTKKSQPDNRESVYQGLWKVAKKERVEKSGWI